MEVWIKQCDWVCGSKLAQRIYIQGSKYLPIFVWHVTLAYFI